MKPFILTFMKFTNLSTLTSTCWNRAVLVAGLIAIGFNLTSAKLHAEWAWPWEAGELRAQVQIEHATAILNQKRAEAAEREEQAARNHSRIVTVYAVMGSILSACCIVYLLRYHPVVTKYIKNEVVTNVVRKEEIVRNPAPALVPGMVVIDGTNVICGSCSGHPPSFFNLAALLRELQVRKCGFKCFFDANTFYLLKNAGKESEAYLYRRLCHDFPDSFVEVSPGNRADDLILDYAHRHGTPIITNDRFKVFTEIYPWLITDPKRRVSFVVHGNMLQIVPLGIQAAIPTDLAAAEASLRVRLGKPTSAPARGFANRVKAAAINHPPVNGKAALATA